MKKRLLLVFVIISVLLSVIACSASTTTVTNTSTATTTLTSTTTSVSTTTSTSTSVSTTTATSTLTTTTTATTTVSPKTSVTIKASPTSPTPVASPATGDALPDPYGTYGFGQDATDEEFAAWIIDVSPDGEGLPAGSGTPAQGATLFSNTCAVCHGDHGQGTPASAGIVLIGTDPWYEMGNPASVGTHTIGNYWQYASTLYDYIRRAMPFTAPESLTNDQVYQVVAWLLNQNGIIADSDVMNAQTLPQVHMPNEDGFVPDPRPWPEVQ